LHGDVNARFDIVVCIEARRLIQFMCGSDARFVWRAGCAAGAALVLDWREHGIIGRRHGPVGCEATVTMLKTVDYTWDKMKAGK
jgi:hypothetical protein